MKRILFVDDEPNILEGLQRMLRPQRRVWDMVFASSGAQALSAMAVEPFDVVVTDMMMPGMNGAELLAQIKARHPGTMRFMLSGHADMEAAKRCVTVSHQFLCKPCETEVLRAAVDRAFGLEALLQDPAIQKVMGSIVELPTLPRVYQTLTVALGKEEVDISEIGAIVEEDVGIATKILQLVNSGFFGIRREITDLSKATAYLGVITIRDLVLSYGMFQQFESSAMPPDFSLEREQAHSLLAARIAKRLLSEKAAGEQAFLAAMLHDVGNLILATHFVELCQTIPRAGVDQPLHAAEEDVFGTGHAEIGAYLLGLWGMPYPVVEAVANHHDPGRVPEQGTFGVLGATHVADALAREQCGCEQDLVELDEQYLQRHGVAEKIPEWRAIAAEEAGSDPKAAGPTSPSRGATRS